MTTYTASVTRSGGWWAVQILELDAVLTQAHTMADVESMARDAIAGVLDVSADSFDVTVVRPK